jgi:pimeloyl-ACP methyl ester carboxylesterase
MSSWLDDSVQTNGIHVHYYRTGGSKPPLLLLHGITDSGLCWTRVARALEQDYDVIMLDARGHGLSDGPETGFSTEILAADAAGLIQALQIQQPYVLGHSMGGATAVALAARYPNLVRAVLLEDPPWRDADPAAQAGGQQTAENNPWLSWLLPLRALPRAERIAAARKDLHWVDEELEPWADSKEQFKLAVIERNVDRSLQIGAWRVNLPQISCPILLITGDPERGSIVTAQTVQEAKQLWQHGKAIHIPDAGHNIRRDQYEPYMEAVTGFLREIAHQ